MRGPYTQWREKKRRCLLLLPPVSPSSLANMMNAMTRRFRLILIQFQEFFLSLHQECSSVVGGRMAWQSKQVHSIEDEIIYPHNVFLAAEWRWRRNFAPSRLFFLLFGCCKSLDSSTVELEEEDPLTSFSCTAGGH